ncbi:hypothetical protein SPRG_09636 [Saprolegnia parasitica CBS 223.65]|uniref:rRNA 2'-O-methyltransferase fibrillarin n=1 Tax=Saprolegnia parasitica (strain CBS 223.65) TaxID=695850 RepID=A0A067CDA7_SAPPC|nr:hypothetical protein SPRG_09636 [Saprolegnia parasitica CBS 223.65]KDO24792.1 hypothetical protein SPRG_09636 [Saprolegnia parasitica CBS 223.65]|eukprot:XP_012204452.1 hypothetical protein SPRG_09636 [Saprolegnia parasitica CBS 223.65]
MRLPMIFSVKSAHLTWTPPNDWSLRGANLQTFRKISYPFHFQFTNLNEDVWTWFRWTWRWPWRRSWRWWSWRWSVYGEKRISVDVPAASGEGTEKVEYRVWNPFRSKLAAAILGGVDNIWMGPGAKVLYIGGASGTTVSHVSDIVGPTGAVYAVEFSHRSGRDLINMAKSRTNVIPIIEDARHPLKYRMLVPMVDTIFADVAQPDQARIVALNASYFLKNGGHFVVSIKASCIDSTAPAEAVFTREVKKLQQDQFKPAEQLTLEPYERDHAVVVGSYRVAKKEK